MTGWRRVGLRADGWSRRRPASPWDSGLLYELTLMAPPGASLPFDLAR
jgi:hypothetical protein